MHNPAVAAIGTAAYLFAVVTALGFFLRAIGHVLSDEGHATRGDIVEAGVCTVLLLFCIIGGFIWFRVLLVGL
jgi:hypothetical protein